MRQAGKDMIYKITAKGYLKLFCLVIVFLSCSCKTLFPQITNQEAEEIKNICGNLKTPPSFGKIRDRYSVKSNTALRHMEYSSPDSAEEVEKYFVNLLKPSGWSYEKEGHLGTLRFRKGKYSISIDTQNFSFVTNKTYVIDCSVGIW